MFLHHDAHSYTRLGLKHMHLIRRPKGRKKMGAYHNWHISSTSLHMMHVRRCYLRMLKNNNLYLNCLQPGHFVRECKSLILIMGILHHDAHSYTCPLGLKRMCIIRRPKGRKKIGAYHNCFFWSWKYFQMAFVIRKFVPRILFRYSGYS